MDSATHTPDTTTEPPEQSESGENTSNTIPTTTAAQDIDPPGHRLRPTQRRFAELVAIGTAKIDAYHEAYPKASPQTCRRESGQLARSPRVLRYIAHLQSTGMAEAEVTTADIAKALKRIAFFDIRTVTNDAGEIKPLSEWPPGAGAIVQHVTPQTANSGGVPKIPDRIAALRTLAEMRGALGQGAGSRDNQAPKATFVFNFGGNKAKKTGPKVVTGERLADQGDVANIGPVSPRLVDRTREAGA